MVFCQDNSQFFQIFLGRDAFYSFEGALQDGAVGKSAVLCDGIVSPFGMNSHDAFTAPTIAKGSDADPTGSIIPRTARSRAGDDGVVGVYGNKERKRTTSCH